MTIQADLIDHLERGPAHRFADFAPLAAVVPANGAGVYTICDDDGGLVYAGIAGRNPAGKGLVSRLRSHASGRRSGDQFCVYVADHYVLPELTREQIDAIRDSRRTMDSLVRERSMRPSRSGSSRLRTTRLRFRLRARSKGDTWLRAARG